ncbi:MAG: GNAT family N-acetyltransferase, partial [Eubacterium sp.]
MQIKTVNLLTYIFEIHPHFEESALTFAKAAFNHDGKLLVLFEGEEPVGLLILEVPDRFDYGVSYLYIRPEWRGKGKAKALLKAAIDLAAEAKRMLQLRIIEENPEAPVFTKWAKDFEFTKVMASKIFVCIPQNKETLKNWEDFMASRGIRLSRYLQRNGYTVSSLRAADPQVMASMNEKFESGVFPSYL